MKFEWHRYSEDNIEEVFAQLNYYQLAITYKCINISKLPLSLCQIKLFSKKASLIVMLVVTSVTDSEKSREEI